MNQSIASASFLCVAIGTVFGNGALAENRASDDYTGAPLIVTDTGRGRSMEPRISQPETAGHKRYRPDCKILEGQFDYAGLQLIECTSYVIPEQDEWYYLY